MVGWEKRKTNPFPVAVFMLLVGCMQINTVETTDREGENQLDEAEDRVCDIGEAHFDTSKESHFSCLLKVFLSLYEVLRNYFSSLPMSL